MTTKTFKLFVTDEDGAVTVDWVVLTALAVGLMSAGYSMMASSTTDLSGNVSSYMTNKDF